MRYIIDPNIEIYTCTGEGSYTAEDGVHFFTVQAYKEARGLATADDQRSNKKEARILYLRKLKGPEVIINSNNERIYPDFALYHFFFGSE